MLNNHSIQSWMSSILKALQMMRKFRTPRLGQVDRYAIKESLKLLIPKRNVNSLSTSHRSISMWIANQLTVSTLKIHKDLRMLLYHKSGSGIKTIILIVSKLIRQPQYATSQIKVTVSMKVLSSKVLTLFRTQHRSLTPSYRRTSAKISLDQLFLQKAKP